MRNPLTRYVNRHVYLGLRLSTGNGPYGNSIIEVFINGILTSNLGSYVGYYTVKDGESSIYFTIDDVTDIRLAGKNDQKVIINISKDCTVDE